MVSETEPSIGCSSHNCILEKPKGIGTNGGCSCLRDIPTNKRLKIQKAIQRLNTEIKELTDTLDEYAEKCPEVTI